jgi:UDP-N-acetylglucosamine:LPS N-acetylglucosamine transferase
MTPLHAQSPHHRVLILTSKTGGGHWSAAQAMESSLLEVSNGQLTVSVTQFLEEASLFTRAFADLYNWLLRYKQPWMRHYFNWIEYARISECKPLFDTAFGYAKRLFERVGPDALVSVHPMMQHFFAYVCDKLKLDIPIVTIVTDPAPGFWSGWVCPQVTRYYVAGQAVSDALVDMGVPSERIYITGMPLRSQFIPCADKTSEREQLGLAPERFTLLMSAGFIGGGNVPQLFEHLIKAQSFNTPAGQGQLIYVTGKNQQLMAQAEQLLQQYPDCKPFTRILPYVPSMAPWLQASDAIVTKLGGLTTFEALACHVGVLADCLTPPMPQEAQTVSYLCKLGAAKRLSTATDLTNTLDHLMHNPHDLHHMQQAGSVLVKPDAAQTIARDILTLLPPLPQNTSLPNTVTTTVVDRLQTVLIPT